MIKTLHLKAAYLIVAIAYLATVGSAPARAAEKTENGAEAATTSDGKPVDTQAGNLQLNSVSIGPILISMMLQGRKFAGKVLLVVSAPDNTKIGKLQEGKDAIHSIAYLAALALFENGRPTDRKLRKFKSSLREDLQVRFGDAIDQVMVKTVF